MFRATMCQSSGETTVFMRHLELVILCRWLSGMQGGMELMTSRHQFHSTLHTRQSFTQNNKFQVSHKHSCFSWWWAHSRPKHVEINKYTKNKLCTKLALFTRTGFTRIVGSAPGTRNKSCLVCRSSKALLWSTQLPIQRFSCSFLRFRAGCREAYHSPPSRAEVKNAWIYSSTGIVADLYGFVLK